MKAFAYCVILLKKRGSKMFLKIIKEIFEFLLPIISDINNIIQFLGIIIVVITFILFRRPSYRIIRNVLRKLGYKYKFDLFLLWKIRGNPNKLARIFVEICIIRSAGEYQNKKSWWKERLKELELKRKQVNDEYIPVYVQNCSEFSAGSAVSSHIDKYFEILHKKKDKFNIREDDFPLKFICTIVFEEGFLMPISLITGLMDRYEQNWKPIIDKYAFSQFNKNDEITGILPEELYFTFGWFVWNPSYEMRDQKDFYKLFQYAFGDENNSVNIIMENNTKEDSIMNDEIWEEFYEKNYKNNINGLLCIAKCNLYENEYIDKFWHHLSPEAHYFANKINKDEKYIFVCKEIEKIKTYKALNYYYSAYIWIMFEWIAEDNNFDPYKTVTFFEHANIADNKVVDFLEERLIEKVVVHFKNIFSRNEYKNRRYRYCISFSQSIYKRFCNRYNEIIKEDSAAALQFKERMECATYRTVNSIFNSFDDSFDDTASKYYEIYYDDDDKSSVSLLSAYYAEVFLDAFPEPDTRESLENMIDYLKKKKNGWYGKNNYHILIGKTENKIISGAICDYFEEENIGVMEYIAVNRSARKKGCAREIFKKAVHKLEEDARKAGHKHLDWIIGEIENPIELKKKNNKKNKNKEYDNSYLYAWHNIGFRYISEFSYIQPALSKENEEVNSLILVAYNPNEYNIRENINPEIIAGFIRNYARWALRIDNKDIDSNQSVQKMFSQLSERKQPLKLLSLKNLIDDNK